MASSARAAGPGASGPGADDPLSEIDSLDRGVNGLADAAAHPGAGDFAVWRKHLDAAATLLLLDQYEEAAYRYFILGNDPAAAGKPERREALFYEGESLFLLGDYRAALTPYIELAAGEGAAPYKVEANVRLVEIASAIGDDEGVDRAWKRFVAQSPATPVEPQVAYALAKSYYRRGDLAKADAVFAQIDIASPKGRQARYFRGVIALRSGDRPAAERIFAEMAALPAEGRERVAIADHARMATARLLYADRHYSEAARTYASVTDASSQRADAMYEGSWAELKAGNLQGAEDDLDLLLIAFPDHPLAPRVKLLRAKLALLLSRDDDAREEFRGFASEYEPVLGQVDEVLHAPGDAAALLARLGAQDGERGLNRALPTVAARAAIALRGMREALALTRGLSEQEGSLSDGRALSAVAAEGLEEAQVAGLPGANDQRRLAAALDLRAQRARFALLDRAARAQLGSAPVASTAGAAGGGTALDAARNRVQAALEAIPAAERAAATARDDRQAKISIMRADLFATRDGLEQARATAVAVGKYLHDTADKPRDPILGKASQASVARELQELAAREREVNALLRELKLREAGTRSTALSPGEIAARSELNAALGDFSLKLPQPLSAADQALLERLNASRARIATALELIARDESARLSDASARLVAENRNLATEAAELSLVRGRATTAAAGAARGALQTMRTSLDGLLLRADLGILDVAWTEKDRESHALETLAHQRDAELEALEKKYKPLFSTRPAGQEEP